MRVRRLETERVCVVEVDHTLNERDATLALGGLDAELEDARLVVLDCAGLEQIASAGVGNILRLKARLALRGATLRLAALRPLVQGVLLKARADHVMEIFDTVDAATRRPVHR